MSLVGTPFPLNFLCGNAVPMRSRPTTLLAGPSHTHHLTVVHYYNVLVASALTMYSNLLDIIMLIFPLITSSLLYHNDK